MSLLFRYVFVRHARLLLLTLCAGLALYLLTDMVERLDSFVEAGSSMGPVVAYFGLKMPSIAAQILPAVFILASVITLCLMARNREMMALEAGGVPPGALTAILVACGLFWGGIQLGFSQFLGTEASTRADRIWFEEIRSATHIDAVFLENLWFVDHEWIVSILFMYEDGFGDQISAYELSDDGRRFVSITRAEKFAAEHGKWTLKNATRFYPDSFITESGQDIVLPIQIDIRHFFVAGQEKPQNLPLWQLGEAIGMLRDSGSNVEALLTNWHARLAYAASLMVMAVLAAAVVSWKKNIYLAVAIAIVITFVFYALTVVGQTMGERGIVPPMAAAWGPQLLLLALASLRLFLVSRRR